MLENKSGRQTVLPAFVSIFPTSHNGCVSFLSAEKITHHTQGLLSEAQPGPPASKTLIPGPALGSAFQLIKPRMSERTVLDVPARTLTGESTSDHQPLETEASGPGRARPAPSPEEPSPGSRSEPWPAPSPTSPAWGLPLPKAPTSLLCPSAQEKRPGQALPTTPTPVGGSLKLCFCGEHTSKPPGP